MAANDKMKINDTASLGDLTVGAFKALIGDLMQYHMLELLRDFENYLPDAETGWKVEPEVWAQVRAFINQADDEKGEILGKAKVWSKGEIPDETQLSALTAEQFTSLLAGVMQAAVSSLLAALPDPDEGKQLKPEVEAELSQPPDDEPYYTLEEVSRELGLDMDEAKANIQEAIELWIEEAETHGDPVPEDTRQVQLLLV